jgi:hypothetical protein
VFSCYFCMHGMTMSGCRRVCDSYVHPVGLLCKPVNWQNNVQAEEALVFGCTRPHYTPCKTCLSNLDKNYIKWQQCSCSTQSNTSLIGHQVTLSLLH